MRNINDLQFKLQEKLYRQQVRFSLWLRFFVAASIVSVCVSIGVAILKYNK